MFCIDIAAVNGLFLFECLSILPFVYHFPCWKVMWWMIVLWSYREILKIPCWNYQYVFTFGNLFTSKHNANDAFFYISERLHISYYTHPYHFYRSRLNIRIMKFSCNWSYKVCPRNISLGKSHQRYVQTISFYIFSLKVILL